MSIIVEIAANGQRIAHADKPRSTSIVPKQVTGHFSLLREMVHSEGPSAVFLAAGRPVNKDIDFLLDELSDAWAAATGEAPTRSENTGGFEDYFKKVVKSSCIRMRFEITVRSEYFMGLKLANLLPYAQEISLKLEEKGIIEALKRAVGRYGSRHGHAG